VTYNFDPLPREYIRQINSSNFAEFALALFHYQYHHNDLYKSFADAVHRTPERVGRLEEIPFLPVSFFKTHAVRTGRWDNPELYFESSGTTGETSARHEVRDATLYRDSLLRGFAQFYGDPADYVILALLPSYLERGNASLVHMADVLMKQGAHPESGFYLHEWERLHAVLGELEARGQKVLLLGVTFALLDFATAFPMSLRHTIVMETGGMKGRREEWTRGQVHGLLKQQWGLRQVHSEYGMTELLSQAYAPEEGLFRCSDTMMVLVRDIQDPLEVRREGAGCVNVIDLANVHSCAFIATDDIARRYADGSFEVLGRTDHAALRGCSLMAV
jgi:hypothetical protein